MAKKAIEEVEREFPDDLPYIITYEKKYLEIKCQECNGSLRLVGANIAHVREHAFSIFHGVKQKEFSQQNLSKDGPLESLDDLDSERQPSKRQRLSPALPVENHDPQSRNNQIAISVAQASKQSEVSPVVSETSLHEAMARLANVEGKLEEQKNINDNLANLLLNLEAKLEGQNEVTEKLTQVSANIENELRVVKTETEDLATWLRNSGGLMDVHGATELQHHKRQIENLEQTISTYRSDFNQSIEIRRSQIRAAGDRIILSDAFAHALKRDLDNLAHSTTNGRANHATKLYEKLKDFTSRVKEQHLSQHTLVMKAVEQKMCSIEPIVKRVENMEKGLQGSQSPNCEKQFADLTVLTTNLDQKLVEYDNRYESLSLQHLDTFRSIITASAFLRKRVATLENTQLSNMASQEAKFASSGEQSGPSDHEIDVFGTFNGVMELRVASLERNDKYCEIIEMMTRVAALKRYNRKQDWKIIDLEMANERLQRQVEILLPPIV
ncbi:aa13db29-96a3-4ebc-ad3a-6db8c154770e [Sclerotinia trifoliorum]|uniref:Aa13db29-96a3-4ebc-ad3a-6db8c154770e n=1 Tax=Sclerotinia trifoliorum TaxID=28548 RepID=A0A8H2W6M4_9HELO|nr:aa13db29-96a3-4ebc-ad3a-6db8c154770e [Sclerotinia trifoliorum]